MFAKHLLFEQKYFRSTKNFGAVMFSPLFLLLNNIAIASAAAVPSSSRRAFAIGKAVRSLTIV